MINFVFVAPARFVRTSLRGLLACGCLCAGLQASTAQSAEQQPGEPGWLPVVVATGTLREQIDATPIENRPYRPLHFYGNTVRRVHYRGTALPRFGEVVALPVRVVARRPGATLTE